MCTSYPLVSSYHQFPIIEFSVLQLHVCVYELKNLISQASGDPTRNLLALKLSFSDLN